MLAVYTEYDEETKCVNPHGSYWIGELHLAYGRLDCRQAWNGRRRMNRAWVRKRIAALLDAIAPGWEIVRDNHAMRGRQGGPMRRIGRQKLVPAERELPAYMDALQYMKEHHPEMNLIRLNTHQIRRVAYSLGLPMLNPDVGSNHE